MKYSRLKPEARKEEILAAALALAEEHGYKNITRDQIADAAQVSNPTLHYHFGTVGQLRRDLMRYAIRQDSLEVIAQGLVAKDPQATKLPEEKRESALRSLM